LLDPVEHIGELVFDGVVRDKRDREPSGGKTVAVDADAGLRTISTSASSKAQ